MKNLLIFLLFAFILALLQATLLPVNLLLLLVLLVVVAQPSQISAWLAFVSGLFLDLCQGTAFGLSSGFFLLFGFILFLYRRHLDPERPYLLLLFVFIFGLLFGRVIDHLWPWWSALILVGLTFLAKPLLKYFQSYQGGNRLKL